MKRQWLFSAALVVSAVAAACNNSVFVGSSDKIGATVTREFTQVSYPPAKATFVQGTLGEPVEASFEQGEWGALDILVVIDNSGSMTEEQENLSTKLESLLLYVEKADWRISVVTTDPADGCRRALIEKKDPQAKVKYQNAIKAGINGTGVERMFLQAVNGLQCGNWLRPDSTVVTLIVTDEDNCRGTITQNCGNAPDKDGAYLTGYLSGIRTLGKDAKVYGIYRQPGDATCTTADAEAIEIHKVVQSTGGKWGSICDADYSTTLQAISQDLAQILKYEFELQQIPDDGTLEILVDGQPWTKFNLEERKVIFAEPPPFGSKVEVAYRHGREGEVENAFTLEKMPAEGSFKVLVDGVELSPDAYQWNAETKQLEFKEAPGERAQIEIAYQEAMPLKESFDIGKDVDPKTLRVVVNDKAVTAFKYSAATGMVTLAPPPPAGATIIIEYRRKR